MATIRASCAECGVLTEQVVSCDVVFRDVEHWWEWGWGNGVRRLLEQVPPESVAGRDRGSDGAGSRRRQTRPACTGGRLSAWWPPG